jgi:hypothetical protein
VGTVPTPLWDEDEPRFAAIARTMVETGDWVVPIYNDTLAVDKPVLMHWCMAAAMSVFGINEFAARLPSVLATLLTALVLLRAGTRWFDTTTGVVAALAFVGCLLVGIEAHAATPDAILVALTAWATILAAEPLLPVRNPSGKTGPATSGFPQLSIGRAAGIGAILGLAVVCKGPIGFVGPLAVIVPWVWWQATEPPGRPDDGFARPRRRGAPRDSRCGSQPEALHAHRGDAGRRRTLVRGRVGPHGGRMDGRLLLRPQRGPLHDTDGEAWRQCVLPSAGHARGLLPLVLFPAAGDRRRHRAGLEAGR